MISMQAKITAIELMLLWLIIMLIWRKISWEKHDKLDLIRKIRDPEYNPEYDKQYDLENPLVDYSFISKIFWLIIIIIIFIFLHI